MLISTRREESELGRTFKLEGKLLTHPLTALILTGVRAVGVAQGRARRISGSWSTSTCANVRDHPPAHLRIEGSGMSESNRIPSNAITPPELYFNRRTMLKLGAATASLVTTGIAANVNPDVPLALADCHSGKRDHRLGLAGPVPENARALCLFPRRAPLPAFLRP